MSESTWFSARAIQIEWPNEPAILVDRTEMAGTYWISTRWFDSRHERLISREALEDHFPPEVLELVDAA